MRTWVRAEKSYKCGLCPGIIEVGAPMQIVKIPGITATRYRCRFCADGDVPPDLPVLVAKDASPTPIPLTRFSADMLPLDFKARAAGDREVGEEG